MREPGRTNDNRSDGLEAEGSNSEGSALPIRWLLSLRALAERGMATPRRRALAAGTFLVAVGIGAVLVASLASRTSEPGSLPDVSPSASQPSPSEQVPIGAASDAAFHMTATSADALGVDVGTEFLLVSAVDIPAEGVRELLHVEPGLDVNVTRESPGEYLIRAAEPLEAGTVYRFMLQDPAVTTPNVLASFAFQTKTQVGVLQTIPRDRATYVPVDSGIELTFGQEGLQAVEEHFRIEPAVPGRIEVHGRVIVFVPQGGLTPGTLYTVTVTQGLTVVGSAEVMADDFSFQFETEPQQESGRGLYVDFARRTAESATSEAPTLETYASEDGEATLPIRVYAFAGREDFLLSLDAYARVPVWAGVTREAFVTDPAGLTEIASFDAPVQRLPAFGKSFVQFPEPLPAGFYLVQSEFGNRPMQSWLQVTDIAVYAAVAEDRTVVWVNDLATEAAIVGATVELIGTEIQGSTGSDGALALASPAEPGNLLVTGPDGRVAIVPLGAVHDGSTAFYSPFARYASDDYWNYLSIDRPLYLPSDTIRFWGIARPREDPGPRTVTVQLTSQSYVGFDYYPMIIADMEVDTTGLGTFSGELAFTALSSGGYSLTTSVDGSVISHASIEVRTYTKPAFQIAVTPDRQAAFAGDEVSFSIEASFLEGTPVPGLELRYGGSAEGQVTTDANGHASVTLVAGQGNDTSYGTTQTSVMVTPIRAEEGEILGEGSVVVYPARLTASAESEVSDGSAVIAGTVHEVDLSRLEVAEATAQHEVLGAPAAGVTVTLDVTDVSYRQVEVGDYYDFIAKVVRSQYRYESVEIDLGTFAAVSDASGTFRHTFPVDPDRDYRIEMRVTDGAGQFHSQQLYVSGAQRGFRDQASAVSLRAPDGATNYVGSNVVELGAPIALAMHRGADELPTGGVNRYLFLKAQRGIRDYVVQPVPSYEFDFAEEDIPSVVVTGVWFNGRTYVGVNYGYHLSFNPAERGLKVEMATDKERYGPGDEATLTLNVTDDDGIGQAETELNISVVDEAVFLAYGGGPCACILESIYASVSAGITSTYASHQYPTDYQAPGLGATTGGPRTDFADVAYFGSVTTDADGHASISFTLPDNLTSWRVTAQAFNDRLMAGAARRAIPVGLTFFAEATLSDEYLMTDRPEITLRSFGGALGATDEVIYSVSAPSLGLEPPTTVSGTAFQPVRVPLPTLREGQHEILIEARSGELEDSLVRTIRVVSSHLVGAHSRAFELESGLQVEGSEVGPTRVVFSSNERGRYLGILQQLTWGYGERLDQMLSRDVASRLLETFFTSVEARSETFDASIYQTPEGGLALFPYAGADLTLSARVAAIAPEGFGVGSLTQYFLGVLEDRAETRERQVVAMYGLAALSEPVLVPLQTLLNKPDLTWRERAYAGLALIEIGDDENARAVYLGLMSEFGESVSPNYRLRVGGDHDTILEATSLAASLGAGLGDSRAPQLFDYTTENSTDDILVELEQISYLANVLPRLSPAPVRFAYEVEGIRSEIALGPGKTLAIELTPQQLASLRLEPIDGATGVASFYTDRIDPASLAVDPDVTVTRTYGKDPSSLLEGELVEIVLAAEFGPQALDGCYQLTDILPSGLRPIVRTHAWGLPPGTSYPYRIDGQRVSFCVSDDDSNRGATYWARVVSPGEYTAEPAVIQSMQSSQRINLTPGELVIVH